LPASWISKVPREPLSTTGLGRLKHAFGLLRGHHRVIARAGAFLKSLTLSIT